jgi:hypothetical protein
VVFFVARVGLFAPSPSRYALGGSATIPLAKCYLICYWFILAEKIAMLYFWF